MPISKRAMALIPAFALIAVACGGGALTHGTAVTTSSATIPSTSTTVAPATLVTDPPAPVLGAALESLCTSLAAVIGEGDDVRVRSLVASLSGAIAESGEGTAEHRQVAAELLDAGLSGEISAEDAAEAFVILAENVGIEACFDVLDELDLGSPVVEPGAVLTALVGARSNWRDDGFQGSDYTLVMFVENSAWFERSDGSEGDSGAPPCGIFGQLIVLVSAGEATEARDQVAGCVVDVGHELWESIPLTVERMFQFIEERAGEVAVEFHPDHGAPMSVSVDSGTSYFGIFVQDISVGHPPGPDEVLAEAASQRAIWEAAGVTDYTITITRQCFCPAEFRDPYTVQVRDGRFVSAERSGVPIDLAEFMPATVDDLFSTIEEAAFADRLNLAYHPVLGYPVDIDIDPAFNIVDEELHLIVDKLVPE